MKKNPDPKAEIRSTWLEKRLPKQDRVRVSDIASAFDVSTATVRNWIESGDLGDVINIGSGSRPEFRVGLQAVIRFYQSRVYNPS